MPRIIKSRTITIDEENIFNPNTSNFLDVVKGDFPIEEESESPVAKSERIIKKATDEASSIVSKAKQDADKIVADAKKSAEKEVEKMFKKSRETGQSEGYNAGYSKGAKESDVLKKKAQTELDAAVAERKKMQKQMEPEIFDLIMSILEKVFGNANAINPQIIKSLVKRGLNEGTLTGNVVIRVSATDYNTVAENKNEIVPNESVNCEIVKDSSLGELDCIIETPFGNIDVSLGHQFEVLKNHMKFIFDNR